MAETMARPLAAGMIDIGMVVAACDSYWPWITN
jgi:hypothetical protein